MLHSLCSISLFCQLHCCNLLFRAFVCSLYRQAHGLACLGGKTFDAGGTAMIAPMQRRCCSSNVDYRQLMNCFLAGHQAYDKHSLVLVDAWHAVMLVTSTHEHLVHCYGCARVNAALSCNPIRCLPAACDVQLQPLLESVAGNAVHHCPRPSTGASYDYGYITADIDGIDNAGIQTARSSFR